MEKRVLKAELKKLWEKEATKIPFFKKFDTVFEGSFMRPHWFAGGKLNASFCLLDSHIQNGLGAREILMFENEAGQKESYSYDELLNLTCQIASQIKSLKITRIGKVAICMPTIPEAICSMLACARLGIPFIFIFSAFSQAALRERLISSKARLLIGADLTYRSGKKNDLLNKLESATRGTDVKVLLLSRSKRQISTKFKKLKLDKFQKTYIKPVAVESNHPLFYLYTSGTTAQPKAVVHSTAGYLVQANFTFNKIFKPKNDGLYWCTADLGWITGHTYVAFAPLLTNTRSFIYEGGMNFPDFQVWPLLIRRYCISTFFSAPTAFRIIERELKHDPRLESLKVVGSVGEKLSENTWYYIHDKFAVQPEIKDVWWQTETGSILMYPRNNIPGAVGQPIDGLSADIKCNQLVIQDSWPSQMIKPSIRYFKDGCFQTGDLARKDELGNYYIEGRCDDIINISGHRVSAVEVEEIVCQLSYVTDCLVGSLPDELRGEKLKVQVVLDTKIRDFSQKIIRQIEEGIGKFVLVGEVQAVLSIKRTFSGKMIRSGLRKK